MQRRKASLEIESNTKIVFSIRPISPNAVAALFCLEYDPKLPMLGRGTPDCFPDR